MTIQAARAMGPGLEFPSAQGRKKIVPFTVTELLPNRDLAVCGSVCTAWRQFVRNTVQLRSRELVAEGLQVDPHKSLRVTVRTYEEAQDKMRQFIARLDPSNQSTFTCCLRDGKPILIVANWPKHLWEQRIRTPHIPIMYTQAVDPASHREGDYCILTQLPSSSATAVVNQDDGNVSQVITLPLMQKEQDRAFAFYWQPGRFGLPSCDTSLLTLEGYLPLRQDDPKAEALRERALNDRQSMAAIESRIERLFPILASYLPREMREVMDKIMKLDIDICRPSKVSVPLSEELLQLTERLRQQQTRMCDVIDDILKDPALCEQLAKLGTDLLPAFQTPEVQGLIEPFLQFITGMMGAHNEGLAAKAASTIMPQLITLRPILEPLQPRFMEFFAAIRLIVDRHSLPAPEVDPASAPAVAAAAVAPAHSPDFQSFVDIARNAIIQREVASLLELSSFQRRVAHELDHLRYGERYQLAVSGVAIGLMALTAFGWYRAVFRRS